MTDQKKWRNAVKPKWAAEAAEAEINALRILSALRWPMHADPEPAPFRFERYSLPEGEPEEGEFWTFNEYNSRVTSVRIRKKEYSIRSFEFSENAGRTWTMDAPRCIAFYRSQADALLALLWARCRVNAAELDTIRLRLAAAGVIA